MAEENKNQAKITTQGALLPKFTDKGRRKKLETRRQHPHVVPTKLVTLYSVDKSGICSVSGLSCYAFWKGCFPFSIEVSYSDWGFPVPTGDCSLQKLMSAERFPTCDFDCDNCDKSPMKQEFVNKIEYTYSYKAVAEFPFI